MELRKKLLAGLAIGLSALLIAGCGGSDTKKEAAKGAEGGKKLVMAINATFPPFESVKEGTKDYTGIDIEIAKYIGKKLGI